jgi:hypothetical protein
MALAPQKQDANLVGFYKIREATLGQVPATGVWQTREPNSFDDLGAEYTKTARRPFSPSRQRKKGSTVDMDADGGYNEDLTQHNMQGEFEEFFFANLRKTDEIATFPSSSMTFTANATTDVATVSGGHGFTTGDGPFRVTAGTALPDGLLTGTNYWVIVTGATTFKFASSYANALAGTSIDLLDTGTGTLTIATADQVDASVSNAYRVNHVPDSVVTGTILKATGYGQSANNGMKIVDSVTAPNIVPVGNLADESNPPVGAKLKVVGHQFDEDDLSMEVIESAPGVVSGFRLVSDDDAFLGYNLIPGAWVFIGGDAAGTYFSSGGSPLRGYARIAVDGVASDGSSLTFDKSTFPPEDLNGAGLTVQVFFADVIKNEDDPDLIVRFSSVMERTLGKDDNGTQSEYITGSVASELTWNSPLANLVNIDMAYVCQKAGLRTGAEGPLSRRANNTIERALGEDAFNTTSNVYRLRMSMIDPNTMNPSPFFARVTEWSATINNNVTSAKAQGVLGGFDTTVGNFDVDAEVTAYFSTVDVIHAVKCNWDVTFDAIYAKQNAGVFFDIPLVSLGGGRLDIEQDAAIMVPLEAAAAESPFGHTAMIGWFDYLPSAAMPDVDC